MKVYMEVVKTVLNYAIMALNPLRVMFISVCTIGDSVLRNHQNLLCGDNLVNKRRFFRQFMV